MASNSEKYDSALLGILQSEGKVAPFLDTILGFLYRRTDFFRLMKTETDKLGFPPGVAHKLLVNIFKKYESLAEHDHKRTDELKRAREVRHKDSSKDTQSNLQNSTSVHDKENADERGQDNPSSDAAMASPAHTRTDSDAAQQIVDRGMEVDTKETVESSPSSVPSASDGRANEDEDKETPQQARERRELQSNPLTYNGASCDAYDWSQTITETDVRVKVPKSIVKGKQVKVVIGKKRIAVSCQQGAEWPELVSGELEWEVKADDSMWTLTPGEFVHINLEKKQERWWERVFLGEAGINTRKIDCSRPMTDLDDEAQAKIEEMMYNQRQKHMGLPQSHEVKTHDILRKAWDAEGSPFKGQPFDPSKFTVDPNGTTTFTGGN